MRHGVSKIKFSLGQDATHSVMRKLAWNFIEHGTLETTLPRAKALKAKMDRLTSKAIQGTEADKRMLTRFLVKKAPVQYLMTTVAPVMKDRVGGYVRLSKVGRRQGDNADCARLEWTVSVKAEMKPIVEKSEAVSEKKTAAVKKPVTKKIAVK